MSLPGSCTHLAPPTLHHNLGHVDDVSHRFYVLSFPALNGFRKDLQLKLFPLPQFLTLSLEITTVCFVSKSADANADHPKEDGFTSQACMWAQCSKDCTTCKTWLQCSRFHCFTPKETQNDETNLAKVDSIGQSYTYKTLAFLWKHHYFSTRKACFGSITQTLSKITPQQFMM